MKKINRYHLITLLLSLMCLAAQAQTTGTFTDSRDGQTYKTFTIENVLMGSSTIWMAQNLNYKVTGSYAYDNNEAYRNGIGLLYTFTAAKIACPNGWHLPTKREYSILINEYGGEETAGEALKSDKGWHQGGNGNNKSGFNGLPGGFYDSSNDRFARLGEVGFWWVAPTPGDEGRYLTMNFRSSTAKLFGSGSTSYVRCIQD